MDATALLQWLEDNLTLHKGVELLYVVDGYEVTLTDTTPGRPSEVVYHGTTLCEALTKAAHSTRDGAIPADAAVTKHAPWPQGRLEALKQLAEEYDAAPEGYTLTAEQAVVDFVNGDEVRDLFVVCCTEP